MDAQKRDCIAIFGTRMERMTQIFLIIRCLRLIYIIGISGSGSLYCLLSGAWGLFIFFCLDAKENEQAENCGKKETKRAGELFQFIKCLCKKTVKPLKTRVRNFMFCSFLNIKCHNLTIIRVTIYKCNVIKQVQILPNTLDTLIKVILYDLIRHIMPAKHFSLHYPCRTFVQRAYTKIQQRNLIACFPKFLNHIQNKISGKVCFKSKVSTIGYSVILLFLQFTCHRATNPAFFPVRVLFTQIKRKQISVKRLAMYVIRRQTAFSGPVCTGYNSKFWTCFHHTHRFNK